MSHVQAQEPINIQRIVLPPERVPAEMDRVKRNALVRLPRDEFEALVRAAAGAAEAARHPPKLVRASYTAALSGDGLVGTAEWKITHTAAGPGRLSLNSMQLALRRATWAGNRPAVLGVLDEKPGAPMELWVERPGEHTLALEWSARGLPEPEGLRFDLHLPPCPVTALELDLPTDLVLLADRDLAVVTGPFSARAAGRRLWRVAAAGRIEGQPETIQLLLRRPPAPGAPAPLVRQQIQSTQKLTLGQAECEFEIDLTVQRGTVHDLTFECDTGLKPYEVQVPGLDEWETGPLAGGRTQIKARLREPFRGGRATVRALAVLSAPDAAWACPGVREAGAALRGETLTIRAHTDLRLDHFNPGGFRWVGAYTASDGSHLLTLRSAIGAADRPDTVVRSSGAVFDVDQNMDWQVEPAGGELTATLSFRVRRGAAVQFGFLVPNAWAVEQVDALPPDPTLRWAVAAGSNVLTVEPGRPVAAAGNSAGYRLAVRLKSPAPRWDSGPDGPSALLPLPDLIPLGARDRKGELSVHVGPALAAVDARLDVYPLRATGLEGALRVRPMSARLRAGCDGDASLTAGRIRAAYRLQLTPTGSVGREVDLFSSVAPAGAWSWKTLEGANDIRTVTPLPALDAIPFLSALGAATSLDVPPALHAARARAGSWWRVTFERPLQERAVVELKGEFPAAGARVAVPLLAVPAAEQMNGTVTLTGPAGDAWVAAAIGVQEEWVGGDAGAGLARRRFRYQSSPAALVFWDRPVAPPVPGVAHATVLPLSDRRVLVRFAFCMGDVATRSGLVRLPAGALLVSARVDGRDGPNPFESSPDGRPQVVLPWTAEAGATCELVYECVASPWRFATRAAAAAPEFPFPLAVRWVWRLPAHLTPLPPPTWHGAPVQNGVTEWTAPPGAAGDKLILLESKTVAALGIVVATLAALAVLAPLAGRRKSAGTVAGLVGAAAAILLLWHPWHLRGLLLVPLIASLATAAGALALALARRRARAAALLAVGLACSVGVSGTAAPAEPVQVYLVPGASGDAASASVLAPPDLVDRLGEFGRRGAPPARPVLLSGRYEGRVRGDVVQFVVNFSAHSFADEPATVTIPLAGVLLRGATVDGKAAFPKPGAGPDRFVFELLGKGEHALTLEFDLPVTGATDREARFGIPELAMSRIVLHLPKGAGRPQALSWRGAQAVTADGDGPVLEADLGRVTAAQLRWLQPGVSDLPAPAPVQEVILWELAESAARVQAVFRHRLGSAFAPRLDYDLPPDWEPAAAAVRAVDERAATVGVIGVKQWAQSEQPNAARLGLEFQTPLTGHIQVSIELIPKRPPTRTPALQVPRAASAGERETFLGVRLRGWDAEVAEAKGLESTPLDAFRDLWQALRADVGPRRPAFAFRRAGDGAPVLRLALRPPAPAGRGEQEQVWRVGPGRAELRALAKWTDVPASGLLELSVPADLTVLELRGAGLRSWSRAGERVQAWLDRLPPATAADKSASLELVARRPLPADAAALEKTPFALPRVALLNVAVQTATVHVQAADGWRVFPMNAGGFRPLLSADPPGVRWGGVTTEPAATAEFRIAPARGAADFDLMTVAESDGRQCVFSTTIDVLPPLGQVPQPNSVAVDVRFSGGATPHFDLPPEAKLREARPGADGGTWVVDMFPGKHRLTVTTRRPVAGDVPFPMVSARALGPTPGRSRRWAVVAGTELRGRSAVGLRLVPPPFAEVPAEAKLRDILARGAAVWRAERDDWRLHVGPATPPTAAPAAVPVEVTTAVDETGYWLTEARYFLFRDSDAPWVLVPDGESPLLALTVDGRQLPEPPLAARIPLLLPPAPGVHEVRVVWRSRIPWDGDQLSIRLPAVLLSGEPVPVGPVVWSVVPPPGRRVQPPPGQAPFGPAARDLRLAAHLDALTQNIAGRAPFDARHAAESRIDQLLTEADARLASDQPPDAGPNGQLLTEWLKQLRDRHPPRTTRRSRSPFDESFDRGAAVSWQTPDAAPPPVRLTAAETIAPERWMLTALVVGLFGAGTVWSRRAK